MTIEQRLEQLEKRNRGLTVALTMMAVNDLRGGDDGGDGEEARRFRYSDGAV